MPTNPTYSLSAGDDINSNLMQNAYLIGDAIYAKTLNTSKWDAMIPKTTLPTGVGEALTSMVFDVSLPTTAANGSTVGLNWTKNSATALSANALNSSTDEQVLAGAAVDYVSNTDGMSYAKFTKVLRDYSLDITHIRAPWMDVAEFRTAANITKQISALMKALTGVVKWGWERRFQESYEKLAGNLVPCLTASTPILDTVDIFTGVTDPVTGSAATSGTANNPFYRLALTDLDFNTSGASNADVLPTAYVSNKILDRIYTRLQILTPPEEAYGMDNGAPVFCLVCSTDASLAIKTETGIRDDVRKSSMVNSLIKPLGISESFRGFYHMTQPDMPRFTETNGQLVRVEPLTSTGAFNSAYDSATYEAAYVVHKEVMEAQIPQPTVTAPGVSFDPVNYRGDWKWLNIKDNAVNLLGDKGFFFGTLACANKPKNIEYAYVILFKRTSTTPAA